MNLINASDMNDPVMIGVATMVLTEIAKWLPDKYVPLDPGNKQQVQMFAVALAFAVGLVEQLVSGKLGGLAALAAFGVFMKTWVLSLVVAFATYKALPLPKQGPSE